MEYNEIREKLNGPGRIIKVWTELGTAVKVTKKEALNFINILEQRRVMPQVDFDELCNSKYLVVIRRKQV